MERSFYPLDEGEIPLHEVPGWSEDELRVLPAGTVMIKLVDTDDGEESYVARYPRPEQSSTSQPSITPNTNAEVKPQSKEIKPRGITLFGLRMWCDDVAFYFKREGRQQR